MASRNNMDIDIPLKILLVEDHTDTASTITRLLQLEGYSVITAHGFQSAIAMAQDLSFDLLICDIGLPDGDGCDLLHALRKQHHIEGIALTGHGMPHDVDRCLKAGFLMHLLKPVSFDRLNAAVLEALAIRKGLVRASPTAGHTDQ